MWYTVLCSFVHVWVIPTKKGHTRSLTHSSNSNSNNNKQKRSDGPTILCVRLRTVGLAGTCVQLVGDPALAPALVCLFFFFFICFFSCGCSLLVSSVFLDLLGIVVFIFVLATVATRRGVKRAFFASLAVDGFADSRYSSHALSFPSDFCVCLFFCASVFLLLLLSGVDLAHSCHAIRRLVNHWSTTSATTCRGVMERMLRL